MAKTRPFIGQDYTKAELIVLVKKLQKRVAALERQLAAAMSAATRDEGEPLDLFPKED